MISVQARHYNWKVLYLSYFVWYFIFNEKG
jgi:hypothetical protein